jgi:hypothetical protein
VQFRELSTPHIVVCQLRFLLESANFSLLPSGLIHQLGGVLDAVAVTGFDITAAADMLVKVVDVGISDHYMLKWRVVLWCVPGHGATSTSPTSGLPFQIRHYALLKSGHPTLMVSPISMTRP